MIHITSPDDGLELFKVLGSDARIEIIKLLMKEKHMNMNEIATRLKITNGAVTNHVKKLEEAGLIVIDSESAGHGNSKICSLHLDKILIDFENGEEPEKIYSGSVKVGHYCSHRVFPTCGLATCRAIIGEVDDNRYFSHPDRFDADILWFTKGYVEYELPNFIPSGHRITQVMVACELSSEAPGVNNDWPSDITFSLNGREVGTWTSPGDYGDVRGVFTPDWWYPFWNQYGLLKVLAINENGTFIDGLQISNVTTNDLELDYRSQIKLKMEVKEDAEHVGGITIFGKTFGNYAQDINVSISYTPI